MRLGKIVTLLLAGFLTFSSLNSLAATKSTKAKSSISAKKAATTKVAKKSEKTTASKATEKASQQSADRVYSKKSTAKSVKKTTDKSAKAPKVVEKSSSNKVAVKTAKKGADKNAKASKAVEKSSSKKVATQVVKKSAVKVAKKGEVVTQNSTRKTKHAAHKHYQTGVASYYANKFNGRRTANGEVFSNAKMTAAHRTLPFGTLIEVTNLRNGRSVIVRINDRGPYAHARVVDLSSAAAKKIGMHHSGVARVKIAILNKASISSSGNEFYVMN